MTEPKKVDIGIDTIRKILPHDYPFLFVDRIIELDEDKFCKGLKNVTYNELLFQGHFKNFPVLPGVIMIEAMAQLSGCLTYLSEKNTDEESNKDMPFLVGVDNTKFKKQVRPGDQIHISSWFLDGKLSLYRYKSQIHIKELDNSMTLACEGTVKLIRKKQ